MQIQINYDDDYSNSYRAQLSMAVIESRKLGFTRAALISEQTTIPDKTLGVTIELMNELSGLFDAILPGYWGNSCQTLSTNIFAYLNSRGIAADIVLGNVIINGTDEFDTTLDTLQREFSATEPLAGHQAVHAWVSLGDDTIIDAALPPRLVKHYKAPPHFDDMIFIGRASEFSSRYLLRYQPILVGTEFFAKTNPPDPMDLLDALNVRSINRAR
ncbi:hypothetical protein [Massilia sp. DWR3-1-1]|uniref:hypothetical protein n=1 Tax=Massilia sp. DWR3-1-1 TaxID=2804559 RepID=UPI003CEB3F5C